MCTSGSIQMARSRAIDRYRSIMRRNEAEIKEDMAAERWDMLPAILTFV